MTYERFIGNRYLRARKKHAFISLITYISIIGVWLGVTALIVVLSVMNGFEQDLRKKIIGANADIIIMDIGQRGVYDYDSLAEEMRSVGGVTGATPYVQSEAMLMVGDDMQGIILRGIDLGTNDSVFEVSHEIVSGKIAFDQEKDIVLGEELALRLGLRLGDAVDLLLPRIASGPLGKIPATRRCRVAGIFKSGYYEYDAHWAYVSIPFAQGALALEERVSGIGLKLEDYNQASDISAEIASTLPPALISRSWEDMNQPLFSAMKMEKIAMFIILLLIVLVAAFNIICTLIMIVMEKTREIGILKSMGAKRLGIMKIFVHVGVFIGVIGTLGGAISGVGLCYVLRFVPLPLPDDVFYPPTMPVDIEPMTVVVICVSAMLLCFLATVYPAYYASRLNPVEALHYE
jgi:lipoprotein-releasing system permease protein